MASFYSGKGGSSSSYFNSIGKASPPKSTSGLFGAKSSSAKSPSSYDKFYSTVPSMSDLINKSKASGEAWNQRMATQRQATTWDLGTRPGGNSIDQLYANQGMLKDIAVGYKPPGSIVGSYGSKGTTYLDPKTGQIVGFKPAPQTSGGRISYSGGGGGGMVLPPSTVEFSLGPAPEMQPLTIDYAKFKDVLEQTQLSPAKVKELVSQYNMSGEDFNALVSAFNPSEAQISGAMSLINDPGRLNSIAEALNRPYREAFNRAMPMYEQNMGLANALANQYLRADIPGDVQQLVARNAAVQRMQTGLFGQSGLGRNIVPRDLGLTALDLQSRGANLLAQTGQLATQVLQATMPISGKEFAVSPETIYRSMRVSPDALLNATYIPATQIFNAYTVPATQVFDTYVSQAQYNQQIANQNLLNRWQTQTLPGQYVPGKGFLGFDGAYTQTRPTLPGTSSTYWQGRRA